MIQHEARKLREKADQLAERLRSASTIGNMDSCYREVCEALTDAMRLRDDIFIVAHEYIERRPPILGE